MVWDVIVYMSVQCGGVGGSFCFYRSNALPEVNSSGLWLSPDLGVSITFSVSTWGQVFVWHLRAWWHHNVDQRLFLLLNDYLLSILRHVFVISCTLPEYCRAKIFLLKYERHTYTDRRWSRRIALDRNIRIEVSTLVTSYDSQSKRLITIIMGIYCHCTKEKGREKKIWMLYKLHILQSCRSLSPYLLKTGHLSL